MSGRATVEAVPEVEWELRRGPAASPRPVVLDKHQQGLVDAVAKPGHGPALLLAGPGTGKSTTLVEAVAARVDAGTDPSRILTLTFSRKAASELRFRIGARLGRTAGVPLAWTFHGFGFSLLSEAQANSDAGRPVRLMSGPEQDVAVRELLSHDLEVESVSWPRSLHAALPTRGFTDEVRALLARARSLGFDANDLRQVAADRDDWAAAAEFMAEYLDVIDGRGVVDYSELVARAVAYAESPVGRERLRKSYDLVLVDEYQDTDPAQERLLQAIAGSGRDLVVVGDPDQSIYAFRGAEVQNILSFPDRFHHSDGRPASVFVLRTSRRCAPEILDASRKLARKLGGAGTSLVHQLHEHRDLSPVANCGSGSVEVRTFPTAEAEADAIADLLRREHLHTGTAWADMAVLVRSAVTTLPILARALVVRGVPVHVAGDERPLAAEPALAPLLTALTLVDRMEALTPESARELLLSPLGGSDPAALRRLGRALRSLERAESAASPTQSSELIHRLMLEPSLLDRFEGLPAHLCRDVKRLSELLERARAIAAEGGSAHDVLWCLWQGTSWPKRLERAWLAGGSASRAADRELDAVVALFEVAARADERLVAQGVAAFLAEVRAQQIPGDTWGESDSRPTGVRLLTAHRSKGLEWEVVVVAGVQAEVWPDLRRRGSLLQSDRLGPSGLTEPPTTAQLRREERRLFYVATTRAKRRLVVTAVDSPVDDGPRVSTFVDELGVEIVQHGQESARPLTLSALTAQLRSVVCDPAASLDLRRAAADRLALLASTIVDGQPLVAAAHPDRWWGLLPLTASDVPVRNADQPLELSGSQLEKLTGCPRQWFLSREVHAEQSRGAPAGFGGVVHALADGVARGVLPDTVDDLVRHADSVWDQLQFAAPWESTSERQEATAALQRFVSWHQANRGRELAASEANFETVLTIGGRDVRLRGRIDRIEIDDQQRVVVVDLKTMRAAPSRRDVESNLQLATYQRAVAESAVMGVSGQPGGAELVQLRLTSGANKPDALVQQQEAFPSHREVLDQALERAVDVIGAENFSATPGSACTYCPFTRSCPAKQPGQELVS